MTSDAEDRLPIDNLPEVRLSEEMPDTTAEEESAADETVRLRAENAALQDRLLRLQAEFENYRKRQLREREALNRQAKERVLGELPGLVDDLERVLLYAGAHGPDPESLAKGVELVCRKLQEVLTRFGAESITALGAMFDPHLHEAVARIETAGDPPDGTVVEEYLRGYLLDGKVLRPAKVAVAKLTDEDGEPEP